MRRLQLNRNHSTNPTNRSLAPIRAKIPIAGVELGALDKRLVLDFGAAWAEIALTALDVNLAVDAVAGSAFTTFVTGLLFGRVFGDIPFASCDSRLELGDLGVFEFLSNLTDVPILEKSIFFWRFARGDSRLERGDFELAVLDFLSNFTEVPSLERSIFLSRFDFFMAILCEVAS